MTSRFRVFQRFQHISSKHIEIFEGEIFPSCFINQEADPLLFTLCDHFCLARFLKDVVITNSIGGAKEARYEKISPVVNWKFNTIGRAKQGTSDATGKSPKLTMDVLIPSNRCDMHYVRPIGEQVLAI